MARCSALCTQLASLRYPAEHRVTPAVYRAILMLLLADYRDRNPRDTIIPLWHGPHGGLMFKGVELLAG